MRAYTLVLSCVVVALTCVQCLPARREQQISQFLKESKPNSTRWAVLIAGSSGYENYRHQADICHAYQLLKAGGLKDENIIVFMYDDIALNPQNPHRGQLFNQPRGSNVYEGVKKDYTFDDVNKNNVFAVLRGDRAALTGHGSGKVLDSGPNDSVFLYFSDHGAEGAICLPFDYISAKEFITELKKLHAKKAYGKMLLYIEACYSGSVFKGLLPNDIDMLVNTAANETESSWAWYCPGDYGVPKEINTCMGDEFSISWMEDADKNNRAEETLRDQIAHVTKRVRKSHPKVYGTIDIESDHANEFEGETSKGLQRANEEKVLTSAANSPAQMYNQHDADLLFFWNKYIRTSGQDENVRFEALGELHEVLEHRVHVDKSVYELIRLSLGSDSFEGIMSGEKRTLSVPDWDWDCLKLLMDEFEAKCGALRVWGMRHSGKFAEICSREGPRAVRHLRQICSAGIPNNKWSKLIIR